MTSCALPFSSLTPGQQASVLDYFTDALFGRDPAHFTYEANTAGEVTGRLPLFTPPTTMPGVENVISNIRQVSTDEIGASIATRALARLAMEYMPYAQTETKELDQVPTGQDTGTTGLDDMDSLPMAAHSVPALAFHEG